MELIAIVGIGCKLPGGANSPAELWRRLLAADDLVTETPPDRWNVKAHYHPGRDVPGRTYSRWGGYVADPAGFDAAFFGLTPRETARMDPQQRWLLETAWEAIQDAGVPLTALYGSGAGVYVGISSSDYGDIQKRSRYDADAHTSTGSALSVAANRVSYLFDLRGPSLAVDTACSSSLVALDLACRALARGDVPLALVGGANAIFQADVTVAFSRAGMLSPTGRCRAFDASADGFVRAEGAAVVVLKPLARALADGDRVYAVVRGTLTNQDGRTGGLTVPSADQQAALLDAVYRQAGVPTDRVGYVEAHGTGTPVGDPIETAALGRSLGRHRPADRPLWVGSVKSNLGHLEPASGVAGLVKLALALHHRTVPPNAHFRTPNPRIPFDEYRLRVPTKAVPWEPAGDGLLYGGVNSFGFGGTNAHAVLSSAPAVTHAPAGRPDAPILWTVSARSADALRTVAGADATLLDAAEPAEFPHLAAVAQRRRTHHPHRVAVVADTPAEAASRLRGAEGPGMFAGHAAEPPAVAVVFTGQGSQWPGMARDLFAADRRFCETVAELDALLRPHTGRGLADDLVRGGDDVFRSDVGQPLLFALQVGVYRLLAGWGLRPAVVFGHSIGEVAAAYAAGALTLADAARVIAHRSRVQELTRGSGAMAAVGLSEEAVRPLLAAHAGRLHVAAYNGPADLTLAGDADAVRAAVEAAAAGGAFARLLPFPYAFHSPAMDPCRATFADSVGNLAPRPGGVPFVSTVTGAVLPGSALDAAYWWHNLRDPVRFAAAVRTAAGQGAGLFLEIGPHPRVGRYVARVLGDGVPVLATLRRAEDGPRCLAGTVAALHAAGVPIDWSAVSPGLVGHAELPRHPWHRKTHWAEGEESRNRRLAGPTHPLLGVREPGPGRRWGACLSAAEFPYLADHGFRTRAVFPAAAHIEVMLSAAAGGSFADPVGLADVNFDRALWADHPFLVQTTHDPATRRLTISSRPLDEPDVGWEVFSRGVARTAGGPPAGDSAPPVDAAEEPAADLYARFERAGHRYGPLFRTVRRLWVRGGDVWADVALDPALHAEAGRYYLHPALLDGAVQAALRATPVDGEREAMFLPVRVDRIDWRRPAGAAVVCRVRDVRVQDVRWFTDIDLFTPAGEWVATLAGCCCVKKPQDAHLSRGEAAVYREEWAAAPREVLAEVPAGPWLVVDPAGAAAEFVRRLVTAGARVTHHCGSGDPFPEFLEETGGTVVIWSAGGPAAEPSVASAVATLDPLLDAGKWLSGAAGLKLWLVTAGATWGHDEAAPDPLQAAAAGLLRTVSTELPGVTCRLLDLDPVSADTAEDAARELLSDPPEDEVAYRGGRRFAGRLVRADPEALGWRSQPCREGGAAFRLATTEPGSLDALAWVEAEAGELAAHEIEIDVRAAGLNFRDVLKALDAYPLAPTEPRSFGDEVAGVVRRVGAGVRDFRPGDEVVAVAVNGFGDRVRVPAVLAAMMPATLSFEEAAGVPIAFLTADHSLNEAARVQPGETVLVHAAAGGVGQAAVQVARRAGAGVLGTASPDKHEFLRGRGVAHAFTSRDLSFADGVRAATGGRGVDVVLNSLAGEFIPRSLELLAPLGRFVEIGKKDVFANAPLDLHPFRQAVSFHAVDLAALIALKPELVGRRLRELLDRFARGEYAPLSTTAYPASRVSDAFRLMAQGRHRGKLVVTFGPADRPARVLVHDRPVVRPGAAYLVTGGLSGFGLRTAAWLADGGATWLVLAGRSGAAMPQARDAVAALEARGVRVEVVRCDVADPAAVERLVRGNGDRPPLRGVVHSAMVLRDEPLSRVSRAALEAVLAPKLAGAWHLHRATRDVMLDWFVTYSSVAALVGSAGQAAYVAANRFLDALAHVRRAEGLPALAVAWGPLAEAGVVAGDAALARYLDSVGLTPLAPDEAFRFLAFLIRRDAATAGVARVDWAKYAAANPKAAASHRLAPVLAARPADAGLEGSDLAAAVLARPEAERPAAVVEYLRTALACVLRAEPSGLDPAAPLTSFGVDSLMAFEFKLRVDRDFKVNVPPDRLAAGATLTGLADLLLAQLASPAAEARPEPATPVPPAVAPPEPAANPHLRVLTRAAVSGALDRLAFDAAALLYVPDRVHTVGGVADHQLSGLFGDEPFVSHLYDLPMGRIGVITLPIRGKDLFGSPRLPDLVRRAAALARRAGARCLSLTGLIPSATGYGERVREWVGDAPRVTTGHATTTAAVVLNLEGLLARAGRDLAGEHLAVLGLGSIGRSCLALALDALPHPAALTLCDVFAKADEARGLAAEVAERFGYDGRVRAAAAGRGLPDELYEATTVLTAVSVPDVIDVGRLRPGTVLVDDSYPPGFSVERAAERAEAAADLLFSNAGMARLPDPIRETVFLPPGAEEAVARFGDAAFRGQLARDPRELTTCILSALLTDRVEGFRATVGLAALDDLRAHHAGLRRLGVTAARPQCGPYFVPDDVVARFRAKFAAPVPV